MRHIATLFLLALLSQLVRADEPGYQVLCYHDIVEANAGTSPVDSIATRQLSDHFAWLRSNGYTVISVQDLVDARSGRKPLPPKAILLTFDDGYASFYKIVFPLLKAYGYPATLSVVGSWLEKDMNQSVIYGDGRISRRQFIGLGQLKEVAASGLVEIASHTYDLHRGILGNPQGNVMPAATTRLYDRASSSYESDAVYEARISADLKKNSDFIEKVTGKRPRVIVWPYGRYNGEAQGLAENLGMAIGMTLDDGVNRLAEGFSSIHRYYLKNDPDSLRLPWSLDTSDSPAMRVMHVDLDYVYDRDPVQQEKNLGMLLERIKASGATAVFLQAYADDDASGVAKQLYFPNRHLPVKADLFGRVSWQIAMRTSAQVYAWLPLTAFIPPTGHALTGHFVRSADGSPGIGYARLSPFSAKAREFIAEIYEDLGRHAYFAGLLIHDDAALSDMEDASADALAYYANQLGLPQDVMEIRQNPEQMARWSKAKTSFLSRFAGELRNRTERFRKPLKLARNYYAEPILNPEAEKWFAQSLPDALRHFDWVAIMAMPYMEKAAAPKSWLDQLVNSVRKVDGADKKVIFELQAKKWSPDRPIPSTEIAGWMRQLRVKGIRHFGYYPDDPFANHPDIKVLKRELSDKRYVN